VNPFKKVWFRPAAAVVGLALFLAAAATLQAQQAATPQAQQADPNVRAARLSYVEGDVQLTQGNQILANPALVNTPLFEGTKITTQDDGRAELQFDDGTVARISPNSSLKIAALRQDGSATRAELDLQSGLAYFELQGDSAASRTTARFGDSVVTASGFTVVRISLDNLPGELAVFTGNAHLQRNTLSLDLHGGESVALNATDPNIYNLAETIEPDSWDAWNADRDQDLTSQEAAKTAASGSAPNSNNPAWSDLDANGNWYNVPGEGYVWSPNEAASGNWDPYGCGNWVPTPQYGYVWVSCEQWGYLPYTSGDWNYYDGFGWGWAPGYGFPWWETGGWGWNIGRRPPRYLPPHRPHGGPLPSPGGGPIRHGGYYQPNPVVAVNRIPSSPATTPLRSVGKPVTIAGNTVAPLKPLLPRPTYGALSASGFTRSNGGYGYPNSAYGKSGYVPWANSAYGRAGTMAPGSGYHAPAPSHAYSGGSSINHPSGGGGGGGGHVSGGGGGGGGGHVGGGGGGGGGGGHH